MLHTDVQSKRASSSGFLGFERAMESTSKHRSQSRLDAFVAQWDVLLTMYRHTVEMPRLLAIEGALDENQHRAVLTNLLGMAEAIWIQAKDVDDQLLSQTGYDKKFIKANLEYLRDKYEAWFCPVDSAQVESDFRTISDALAKAS